MSAVSPKMRHSRGVTLIELMIVVAVIGILTTIAYPTYTSYSQRGKIGEAFAQLAQLRVQMEQYYQDNRQYISTTYPPPSGFCGMAAANGMQIPSSASPAGTSYFTYSCAAVNPVPSGLTSDQTYILTATGIATQGMSGFTYTIDYAGTKQTTQFSVNGTALTTVPRSCWLLKSGDC